MPASHAGAGDATGAASGRRCVSVPAVVRREAGERAGRLLAAGADDAGDAEDLAGVRRRSRRRGRRPTARGLRLDEAPRRDGRCSGSR